jgi:hypothetical protein
MHIENPYDAIVSAIVLDEEIMNDPDTSMNDVWNFIINAGENDGISNGQKYQVFSLGKEIFDPSTKESLGRFEIIKGTAVVVHVQDRMSKLRSDNKTMAIRENINALMALSSNNKPDYYQKSVPFSELTIGDLVRRI